MKPDWSKAPEWAGWWTLSDEGLMRWHETKPTLSVFGNWACEARNQNAGYIKPLLYERPKEKEIPILSECCERNQRAQQILNKG